MNNKKAKKNKLILFVSILFCLICLGISLDSIEANAQQVRAILKPEEVKRHTYHFYIDGVLDESRTQILKNGQILKNPGEPT